MEYAMVEHFGGLSEYLEAPYWLAKRHEFVWRAHNLASAEHERREAEKFERGA